MGPYTAAATYHRTLADVGVSPLFFCNSCSRFGKFTLLNFGKTFYISGGKVSNFLLEKSRVVRQQKGERNYHIFYQLVAGASDGLRTRLQLPEASSPDSFYYLSQSGCLSVDGLDDAEEFSITR